MVNNGVALCFFLVCLSSSVAMADHGCCLSQPRPRSRPRYAALQLKSSCQNQASAPRLHLQVRSPSVI